MPLELTDASTLLREADDRGMRKALMITALPLELEAVRADLTNLGSSMTNGVMFEFEKFSATGHDWLIVTGECSAGNLPAATFTTTAIQKFGPFEVIIFVGVAGSRKVDDAPIGSVLIGRQVYLAESGKYKDGQFFARAKSLPVDPRLLALSQKIARDRLWLARVKPSYCGASPEHEHYPKPFPPKAILCPIVSVEAVSADPHSTLEQHIDQAYQDAVGVEMEGYGALQAALGELVPCIVIRGVSDALAGKSAELDKVRQPIAAGHAAAFAFELLDAWSHNVSAPTPQPASKLSHPLAELTVKEAPLEEPPALVAEQTEVAPALPRTLIVVNLTGAPEDYPAEIQAALLQAIRDAANDPEARITGVEKGSFHIFIEVAGAFANSEALERLRANLTERFASVSSVTTEADFRASQTSRDEMKTASLALMNWPQKLPDGTLFPRPELAHLLDRCSGSEGTTTALLGDAGSGKTALLASFAQTLADAGVPFLAIKADLLDASVSAEDQLQQNLDLRLKPSTLILEHARVTPTVLIIDQLDALAGYLDIKTGRLSALLNLVRKLGGKRNVHVVLSARTFEFEHDVRLRAVSAEPLRLELPPWSAVLKVLTAHDIDPNGWPPDAQQMLRSPQHLSTFLKLSKEAQTTPYEKYQVMLERLWQERILALPNGSQAAQLAGTIAEDMASKESLWIAAAQFDGRINELKLLEGAGVLTRSHANVGSIGFSHQTVFEFALARSFAQGAGRLSSYIAGRGASLFVRPKLWAALTYLRGTDPHSYETELRAIWLSNLRPHLRHLILDFLGQQQEPTSLEEGIFKGALSNNMRATALQAMVGSNGWFKLLSATAISEAMQKQSEHGMAVGLLARAAQAEPDSVLDLVEKHWLQRAEFDRLAWYVLQEMPSWNDRALDVAKLIVSRSEQSGYGLDYTISHVGAKQPEHAIQLAHAGLERRLSVAVEEAEKRAQAPPPEGPVSILSYHQSPAQALEDIVDRGDGWDSLEPLANAAPEAFIRTLWPWFVKLLGAIRKYDTTITDIYFPIQHRLDFRFEEEGSLDLPEHPILGAFRSALEEYSANRPSAFVDWLERHEAEDAAPAQRLFAHALAHSPEQYAERTRKFFLDDFRRLFLGNVEDVCGTSRRVVKAASAYWDEKDVQSFAKSVLDYAPAPSAERKREARRLFIRLVERVKLRILEVLPADKHGAEVLRFVTQARRKFGDRNVGATYVGPTWVGSPMSTEAMEKARDEDVLNAFQEVPDDTAWDHPKDWMKGGNIQLSRAFADFSKRAPERAVAIMMKFTPESGSRAAGYALDAMAEAADPQLVLDAVQELEKRNFSGEEYRGSVASAIERLLRRDVSVSDDILNMLVAWLSLPGPEPKSEEESESEDHLPSVEGEGSGVPSKDREDRSDSVLWGYGRTSLLPHGNYPILETITRILLQRRDSAKLMSVWNAHLQTNESAAVWAAMLRFIRYIPKAEQDALQTFLNDLVSKYPKLIESQELAIGVAYVRQLVPEFVERLLRSWRASISLKLVQTYGEITALIWLTDKDANWVSEYIEDVRERAPVAARLGAAHAAANVWADLQDEDALDMLAAIASKGEAESWPAVLDVFRVTDAISPSDAWRALLRAIIPQIAIQPTFPSTFVIDRLQTLLPHEAELVGEVALALVTKWKAELADVSSSTAAAAPELVDLAITLHRLSPETREVGTTLFEELLRISAYTAQDTLNQIDNRFPLRAPSQRARLPRRQRRRVRRRAG